jgi:hypothetical protein
MSSIQDYLRAVGICGGSELHLWLEPLALSWTEAAGGGERRSRGPLPSRPLPASQGCTDALVFGDKSLLHRLDLLDASSFSMPMPGSCTVEYHCSIDRKEISDLLRLQVG